ncbi:MAG: hypothetical protein RLZZ245_144 [Verrucomicrobiota bacterium]
MKNSHFLCLLEITYFSLLFAQVSFGATPVWEIASRQASPTILSAAKNPDGFRLAFEAPPGNYTLERSINLQTWASLGGLGISAGSGLFTDVGALTLDRAFYRIAGSFEEVPMGIIGFSSKVASGGMVGGPSYGGLWTGHSFQNFVLQRGNSTDALLRFSSAWATESRVETMSDLPMLAAWVEKWNEDQALPTAVTPNGLSVDLGEDQLELISLEGGDYSWVGLLKDENSVVDNDYQETSLQIEMPVILAKSRNASSVAMDGNWGLVRIMTDATSSEITYAGAAYPVTFSAGATQLDFSQFMDFEIEQYLPSGGLAHFSNMGSESMSLATSVTADGAFHLLSPEGLEFTGRVSPSAKFLAAAASPMGLENLPDGASEAFLPNLEEVENQWLLGVKRTFSPDLAGKSYRIIRKGWWVEGQTFEIDASGTGDRLVFNSSGTSAMRSSEFNFSAVDFSGFLESSLPGEATIDQPMSVTVDERGQIEMQASFEEEGDLVTIRSFGFAREGSDLLILVVAIQDGSGGAGIGLIIAVREP